MFKWFIDFKYLVLAFSENIDQYNTRIEELMIIQKDNHIKIKELTDMVEEQKVAILKLSEIILSEVAKQ